MDINAEKGSKDAFWCAWMVATTVLLNNMQINIECLYWAWKCENVIYKLMKFVKSISKKKSDKIKFEKRQKKIW